jgi:hypothetical protein
VVVVEVRDCRCGKSNSYRRQQRLVRFEVIVLFQYWGHGSATSLAECTRRSLSAQKVHTRTQSLEFQLEYRRSACFEQPEDAALSGNQFLTNLASRTVDRNSAPATMDQLHTDHQMLSKSIELARMAIQLGSVRKCSCYDWWWRGGGEVGVTA